MIGDSDQERRVCVDGAPPLLGRLDQLQRLRDAGD